MGKLSVAFPKPSRGVGSRRDSLYLTPGTSFELLEVWTVLCERRIELDRWCITRVNLGAQKLKPDCATLWEVVARNAGRAKRRRQRVR